MAIIAQEQTPLATSARAYSVSSPLLPKQVRSVTQQFPVLSSINPGDLVVFTPTKNVSGTIYDVAGVPVANATVKLIRQYDDRVVQLGVTNAQGQYFFLRDAADSLAYYVIAYTNAVSPQVHGISDRGVTPL